jgi:AbrB family looped-hinge helix DNA binding protein
MKKGGYVVTAIEYKGQLCVPIPKEVCEELDIHEGTMVSVDITPDGEGIIVKKVE